MAQLLFTPLYRLNLYSLMQYLYLDVFYNLGCFGNLSAFINFIYHKFVIKRYSYVKRSRVFLSIPDTAFANLSSLYGLTNFFIISIFAFIYNITSSKAFCKLTCYWHNHKFPKSIIESLFINFFVSVK